MNSVLRIQLSAMMFLQYFVWGAWFVTLGSYMAKLGFGDIIGRAFSTQGLAAIIAPLFVGMIADRFFSAQKVYAILHLIGAALMWFLSTITGDKSLFYIVTLAYMLSYMPTLALSNSIAMNAVTDTQKQFAGIRVFGTIGWIAAGLALSFIIAKMFIPEGAGLTVEQTAFPMKLAAIGALILGVGGFFLPSTPPAAKGQKVQGLFALLGLDVMGKVKEPSFWVFIACSLLICIPLAFYYGYTNAFLVEMKAPNAVALQSLGQMSEIVFMLLLPLILVRVGFKITLLVGMVCWAIRYVMFAYGFEDGSIIFTMALVGILLHGLCYDLFFVAGQIFVDTKLPKEARSRAQSFLSFVTLGLGTFIGGELSNWVANTNTVAGQIDWQNLWLIPAGLSVVVAVIFMLTFKESKKPSEV
ncbi:MFS transporter [Hirschia litorea]|uniref:MFS transporter n=1 Tax=Hirschia litorea TaxID=1199156 RepID=A0ABW2IP23_9PROT